MGGREGTRVPSRPTVRVRTPEGRIWRLPIARSGELLLAEAVLIGEAPRPRPSPSRGDAFGAVLAEVIPAGEPSPRRDAGDRDY